MLSDEHKALVMRAAELLRHGADVIEDEGLDGASDARDTADKLDAMASPKPKSVAYDVGSGSRDNDDTKPNGLTKQTKSLVGDGETEMV